MLNDCLDLFITKLQEEAKSNEYLNNLKNKDNYEEIKDVLNPNDYNMIVTPKEIDLLSLVAGIPYVRIPAEKQAKLIWEIRAKLDNSGVLV